MPLRYDFQRLPAGKKTPQGFLRVPGHPTSVGVFTYTRRDGTKVRELRPPDEVFHGDSLATLRGAPITDLHPSEMVKPENVRGLSVGVVGDDVRQDGGKVAASLTVMDATMIAAVERRDRVELSCGYDCAVEVAPGRFDGKQYGPHVTSGEHYDAIQRRIVYNHVALGPENWGRQGKDVRLKLDASGALELADDDAWLEQRLDASGSPQPPVSSDPPPPSGARKPMDMITIRIDGVDYEIPKAAAPHVQKALADRDSKITSLTADRDKASGRADAADKKAEGLETKVKELGDPKRIDAAVSARASLVTAAGKVLDDGFKFDGLTTRQVHEAVLKKLDDKIDLEGKSDDYVAARFDAATADGVLAEQRRDKSDETRRSLVTGQRPDSKTDADAAAEAALVAARGQAAPKAAISW